MNILPRNEIRISITSACNMKCIYCHNEGNKEINFLTKKQIEEIIISGINYGLKSVRLTGGEPLIHPDIEEICYMISKKYGLKLGINSNGIETEKLLDLINKGYVNRVVIGIDYFEGIVSKNSPVGLTSKTIFQNILKLKETKCNISIATVYNYDYFNIKSMLEWCIKNDIRLKILEEVNTKKADSSEQRYLYMRDRIVSDFDLDTFVDKNFNELNGKIYNKVVVSFFHSHCRIDECSVCKKMHLRVTANGYFKQCLHSNANDISIDNCIANNSMEIAIRQDIEIYKKD